MSLGNLRLCRLLRLQISDLLFETFVLVSLLFKVNTHRLLILHVILLVLLPEVDLVDKLFVSLLHKFELGLDLAEKFVRLSSLDLSAQLAHQTEALVQSRVILVRNRVHLVLELPKVLVVAIRLIVVLVDAHDVVLLAPVLLQFNLIDLLLLLVDLHREDLVTHLLLLHDEV